MKSKQICYSCMKGYIYNGICSNCGKSAAEKRLPDALPANTTLAEKRYVIGNVIGHGGFGITYIAWDRKTGQRVAIKEFFPQQMVKRDRASYNVNVINKDSLSFYQHLRRRFYDEAQTMLNLQRFPEITRVYDRFDEYGTSYFVMEYLEGENLKDALKHGKVRNWERIEYPIHDTLNALNILHSLKLIHRDISPDNIFLQSNGTAKLIDFGSVRSQYAGKFTTIFKKNYAPPEMFRANGNQGPWTDIYSLCASIYYLLSRGSAPVGATERILMLSEGKKDPLKPLASFSPDAPSYVIRAVEIGMSINEKQRYSSIEDLETDLFPDIAARTRITCLTFTCSKGYYSGKRFQIFPRQWITLGRGSGNSIRYPMDPAASRGISRKQCSIFWSGEGLPYVRDESSSYGTFIEKNRLQPLQWYPVKEKQRICFGFEEYVF